MLEITGVWFTNVTAKLNERIAVLKPSLTKKLIFVEPNLFVAGVNVAVQFGAVPPKTIFAVGIKVIFEEVTFIEAVHDRTLSTSLIVKLTTMGVFSGVVLAVIAEIVGGSSIGMTVTSKISETGVVPSVTVKVKFKTPFAFAIGVMVATQLGAVPLKTILLTAIMAALLVALLIDVVQLNTLSTSEIVKLIVKAVSSFVICAPINDLTGGSFTGVTVNVKFLTSVNAPSVTVKLIFEIPFMFGSEVSVAVQFGAVPLNTIFDTLSNAAFDDVADIEVVQFSVLSTSVIVKLKDNGISSRVV